MAARQRPTSRLALLGIALLLGAQPAWGQASGAERRAALSGRISLLETDQSVNDVGQAVLWLEATTSSTASPLKAQVFTENKQFVPRLTVVPVGSTVAFPNHDPFNHNVFSLSEAGPFDLGLYARGEGRTVTFSRPGLIKVFCNVHARMSAYVLVYPGAFAVQPTADGGFRFNNVPPGRYTLRAWHERGGEVSVPVDVRSGDVGGITISLDARRYRPVQHLDKEGKSYGARGRRY